MNDGIHSKFCSLSYTSVDEVALVIARLGRGARGSLSAPPSPPPGQSAPSCSVEG